MSRPLNSMPAISEYRNASFCELPGGSSRTWLSSRLARRLYCCLQKALAAVRAEKNHQTSASWTEFGLPVFAHNPKQITEKAD